MPTAFTDSCRPPALPMQGADRPACPRCGSQDTKFCYYNNYNLTQPRYFCKSCRRYWTLGGTLRNIPVGGTTRKSHHHHSSYTTRRRRRRQAFSTSVSPAASSTSSPAASAPSSPSIDYTARPISTRALANPLPTSKASNTIVVNATAANDASIAADVACTFGPVLSEPLPPGFLALGDPFFHGRGVFGLGGFEEVAGFGLSRGAWSLLGDDVLVGGGGGVEGAWRVPTVGGSGGGGDSGAVEDADCFGWPDLTIATNGRRLQ